MKEPIIVALLALTCSGTSFADASVVGSWRCTVISEYGEFESILMLNDDNSYAKKQNVFGEITVGSGSWFIDGAELVMKREKYSENGEEKASSQEFRRNIVSISDTTLEMNQDKITTTCNRL